MAKTGGTLAMIRAKPNARGKTSHLPLTCMVEGCDKDFIIAYDSFDRRKRYCVDHAPTFKDATEVVLNVTDAMLKKLGLIK